MKAEAPPEGCREAARHDSQTANPFDPQAYIDAVAPALGLAIAAEHRDAVAASLVRLHDLAQEIPEIDPTPRRGRGAS